MYKFLEKFISPSAKLIVGGYESCAPGGASSHLMEITEDWIRRTNNPFDKIVLRHKIKQDLRQHHEGVILTQAARGFRPPEDEDEDECVLGGSWAHNYAQSMQTLLQQQQQQKQAAVQAIHDQMDAQRGCERDEPPQILEGVAGQYEVVDHTKPQ